MDVTRTFSGANAAQLWFSAPRLAVIASVDQLGDVAIAHSLTEVERVTIGRGERAPYRTKEDGRATLRLQFPDQWLSSQHAEIVWQDGMWRLIDLNSKNGTFVGNSRVGQMDLSADTRICVGGYFLFFQGQVPRHASDLSDILPGTAMPTLFSLHRMWRQTIAELAPVCKSDVPIVLGGDTGTGKEFVARAIHVASGRSVFVAVNCGALPEQLIESELFGHRKGAFSGATDDRPGLIKAAHGGTLFLDEIGDMPLLAQTKLLRVLQEREVVALGSTTPTKVDIRVLAASNRNLAALVAEGKFRQDLLARLSGFAIHLPALAERCEDIGLLLSTLGKRVSHEHNLVFDREGLDAILRHTWPNNIRELEQVIRAGMVRAAGGPVGIAHLPSWKTTPPTNKASEPAVLSREDQELQKTLLQLFAEHGGNVSEVARSMGKARVQIRRWCKRLGIHPESFKTLR